MTQCYYICMWRLECHHTLCTSFIFNYRQYMLVYCTYANECGCVTLQIWYMFAYNLVIIFSGYALFNYLTTMTLQYHSACYDTHACYIHTYIHTSAVFSF